MRKQEEGGVGAAGLHCMANAKGTRRTVVRRMDESVPSYVCHPPRNPLYTPVGWDTPGRRWIGKDPDAGNIGVNESKNIAISRASTIRTCDGNDGSDGKFDSNVRRHRAVGPLRPLERAGRTAALNFPAGRQPASRTRRRAGGKTPRLSSAFECGAPLCSSPFAAYPPSLRSVRYSTVA